MLSQDEFEKALKKDRNHLFAPNPGLQPLNELFNKPVVAQIPAQSNVKSKRDELWEVRRKRRDEKSPFPNELIGVPAKANDQQQIEPPRLNPPSKPSFKGFPQSDQDEVQRFNMKRQMQNVEAPSIGNKVIFSMNVPKDMEEMPSNDLMPPSSNPQPNPTHKKDLFGPAHSGSKPDIVQKPKLEFLSRDKAMIAGPSNIEYIPQPQMNIGNQRPPSNHEHGHERISRNNEPPPQGRGYVSNKSSKPNIELEAEKKKKYFQELKEQYELKERKAREEKERRIAEERAYLNVDEKNNPFGNRNEYAAIPQPRQNFVPQDNPEPMMQNRRPNYPSKESVDPQMDIEAERRKKYSDELKRQLELKEEKAKQERLNRIMQERAELQMFEQNNPFGKAGAGAPLKDRYGNVRAIRRPISEERQEPGYRPIRQPVNNPYIRPPYPQSMEGPIFPQGQEPSVKPPTAPYYPRPNVEQYPMQSPNFPHNPQYNPRPDSNQYQPMNKNLGQPFSGMNIDSHPIQPQNYPVPDSRQYPLPNQNYQRPNEE